MKSPKTTIDRLNQLLSDIVVLGQMTHSAHWNVVGPSFYEFHLFFETLYNDLQDPIDEIAERIRALHSHPISTLAGFVKKSQLEEIDADTTDPKKLLSLLETAYTTLSTMLAEYIALEEEDTVTQDMYVGYKNTIDKRLWMITSFSK